MIGMKTCQELLYVKYKNKKVCLDFNWIKSLENLITHKKPLIIFGKHALISPPNCSN